MSNLKFKSLFSPKCDFLKIPNAILSNKTKFGIREKMPKLPARGARVPGGEQTF